MGQGLRGHFRAFPRDLAGALAVRHDHTSAYMSDDSKRETIFLGMLSSLAFVREPEGNGCAERLTRTLRENTLWVRAFATIEGLRLALLELETLYNERWLVKRLDYRNQAQARKRVRKTIDGAA